MKLLCYFYIGFFNALTLRSIFWEAVFTGGREDENCFSVSGR
jgi:hypothetical protein